LAEALTILVKHMAEEAGLSDKDRAMLKRWRSNDMKLGSDDMLFLFTDGVSEAEGGDGEYGVERIVNLLCRNTPCCAGDAVSACLEDLRAFVGTQPGTDDVTLLALRHLSLN